MVWREKWIQFVPFALYLIAMSAWLGIIFAAPLLEMQKSPAAGVLYEFFATQCHQLTSRSLRVYASNGGYSINDCIPGSDRLLYTKQIEVVNEYGHGFKLPMCARDTAIFVGMLAGGLLVPFVLGAASRKWPSKWILLAAMVPIAVDGTTQLVGWRESTNFWRIATGGIIGVVMPFYIIPIMNQAWHSLVETRLGARGGKARGGKKK